MDSPPATFPELSSSVQTGVGRLPVWLVRIMGFGSGYYKKSELGLIFLELELRLNPDPVLEPNQDQLVLEPELKK